ncbi:MAG: copper resistance protein CopC [Gemmatimonadales bacterium]|nr:copper resistance protein CopC [Gemmatimonadales bacterium]MYG20565.1 copper resistance protein CopC [Gemmatimonadales bacterium]
MRRRSTPDDSAYQDRDESMCGWIRRGAAVVAAAAFSTAGVFVGAHLALEASSPKKDAMVTTSPETVTLWFTEAPQMAGTSVRLLPNGGEPLDLEPATADQDDPSVVVLEVSETLADGDYEVMWRAMSQDGHTIRGDFGFTVQTAR